MQMTKCAFVAILKFSDCHSSWVSFLIKVKQAKEKLGGNATSGGIRDELDQTCKDKFQDFVKKYDQASQMRKWISSIKLEISERIEKDEDKKFRDEYAEANPSLDPLTGPLSDEQKD